MKRSLIATAGAICLALGSGAASALDFTITNVGNNISLSGTTISGLPSNGTGGPFTIAPSGAGWPAYVPGSFASFCIELLEHIGMPPQNLTGYSILPQTVASDFLPETSPPNGPVSTNQLKIIGQLLTYAQSAAGFGSAAAAFNQTNGTALQAAVWEIVYENIGSPSNFTYADFNLGAGDFQASNAGSATAITMINTWFSGGTIAGVTGYQNYAVLYSPTQQDFLVPVPEPEAYGLALAGMGVVAFAMRRRRSAEKPA